MTRLRVLAHLNEKQWGIVNIFFAPRIQFLLSQ